MEAQRDTGNELATAAITAVAAASKTPFKTAFKLTMGIAAAQLLSVFLFFGGLFGFIVLGYLIFRH